MKTSTKRQARLIAAISALTLGSSVSTAQSSVTGIPELPSCEDANVSLHDLAISGRGRGVRSFYEGNVLVLKIDQVEPAAASAGVIILLPDPESEMGDRKCYAATGFNGLDLDKAKSHYSNASGLRLKIAATRYDPETGTSVPGRALILRINASAGTVTAIR